MCFEIKDGTENIHNFTPWRQAFKNKSPVGVTEACFIVWLGVSGDINT